MLCRGRSFVLLMSLLAGGLGLVTSVSSVSLIPAAAAQDTAHEMLAANPTATASDFGLPSRRSHGQSNRAPLLQIAAELRAIFDADGVVTPATAPLVVSDPDGDRVRLRPNRGVPGLSYTVVDGLVTELVFAPRVPGTWPLTLTALDDSGASTVVEVNLVARYTGNPGTLLAMGDSVASGHGRDLFDYLGGDSCWRAERQAYGRRVFNALRRSGVLRGQTSFDMVACSGATATELLRTRRDGATQVDHAVRSNPAIITLTVGANDIEFDEPWNLVTPDDELNVDYLDPLLGTYQIRLTTILRRLLESTDATVVVTTYYNPAAQSPQGIQGCRRACFAAISNAALDRLNDVIFDTVDGFGSEAGPSDRVVVADIRAQFEGHGAPNGFGPDGARENGLPVIRDVFGRLVEGTHPYCARGRTRDDSWVSRVDCVHPNGAGHRTIAGVVVATLDGLALRTASGASPAA